MAGTRVFIFSSTMVKGKPVRAGLTVVVDKADFNTLTKVGRGVDPDTAEGKEAIKQWKDMNSHMYDEKGNLLTPAEVAKRLQDRAAQG